MCHTVNPGAPVSQLIVNPRHSVNLLCTMRMDSRYERRGADPLLYETNPLLCGGQKLHF